MTELSVVLISKDQEWNIARLVESVLRETDHIPEREIVLVDSASTDRTTEIAARYPITVLKMHPAQRLTAAAGRYVGFKRTTGNLVLFLDGDMEFCNGWLDQALGVMHSRSDVAVVCGRVIDLPKSFQALQVENPETPGIDSAGMEVRQAGGASMYRRSVLEIVGTFNPYLYSDEEPELCLRIRHAGHRILRLSLPIAYHYTAPAEAFLTFLNKRRGNIWLGYGQNLRYFLGSPLLLIYLRERGWVLPPAIMLSIGIIALAVSALTGQWKWLGMWGAMVILLIVGIAIRKRSVKHAFLILFRRLLILEGTVRGFLLAPYDPAGYPGRYDVIH